MDLNPNTFLHYNRIFEISAERYTALLSDSSETIDSIQEVRHRIKKLSATVAGMQRLVPADDPGSGQQLSSAEQTLEKLSSVISEVEQEMIELACEEFCQWPGGGDLDPIPETTSNSEAPDKDPLSPDQVIARSRPLAAAYLTERIEIGKLIGSEHRAALSSSEIEKHESRIDELEKHLNAMPFMAVAEAISEHDLGSSVLPSLHGRSPASQ